ncbi:MAG TPA: FtsX-like permease family protein [Candidatus Paceibacterota bacterium]
MALIGKETLRVGFFLGKRQLLRAPKSTTVLMIVIMTLTFLSLVGISGILVGLIEGGNIANKDQFTGGVIIKNFPGKNAIENGQTIKKSVDTIPGVTASTQRYITMANVVGNYVSRRDFEAKEDNAGTQLTGINVMDEERVSGLSRFIVEGEMLTPQDRGYVLLGANLFGRYSSGFGEDFDSLGDVYPGDRVRIEVNGAQKEFTVKGIIKTKVAEVSIRAFVNEQDFFDLAPRPDLSGNEIAIKHDSLITDDQLKGKLMALGFDQFANIKTAAEAIPDFLLQIRMAFSVLGAIIGFIGLLVSSVTVFIIIYINTVARRKFIGFLKAVGVNHTSVEIASVFQAVVYSIIGVVFGFGIIYGLLVPFFNAHPLNFPFSDGIMSAPLGQTVFKGILIIMLTALAGYLPARKISRKPTLESILGRS